MAQDTIFIVVTGQEIIDAVKAIAQKPHVVQDYYDGDDVFIVGQISCLPYEHLIIATDGGLHINPKATYKRVTVREHDWGGEVYLIGYGRDRVIDAVKEFTRKLKQQLEVTGGEDGSTNG